MLHLFIYLFIYWIVCLFHLNNLELPNESRSETQRCQNCAHELGLQRAPVTPDLGRFHRKGSRRSSSFLQGETQSTTISFFSFFTVSSLVKRTFRLLCCVVCHDAFQEWNHLSRSSSTRASASSSSLEIDCGKTRVLRLSSDYIFLLLLLETGFFLPLFIRQPASTLFFDDWRGISSPHSLPRLFSVCLPWTSGITQTMLEGRYL